jgi:HAD superfamily hydrolase (TIGR01459 family)
MSLLYIDGLKKIVDKYDSFIIDLWGVIHDGFKTYPYVKDSLLFLRDKGKKVYFLSNSPRRCESVANQLERLGITLLYYDGLYTSGEDAYETFSQKEEKFYVSLGTKVYPLSLHIHSQLFEDLNLIIVDQLKEASFILNTGPNMAHAEDFDEILQEAQKLSLPMICVNPDISVISSGKVTLCAGSIAARYEAQGGIVKYHGKPYPEIYRNLFKRMGNITPHKVLAIGDSLTTDIKGANTIGIDSALVLTGLSAQEFGDSESTRSRLEQSTHQKDIYPTYVLKELSI